MLIIQGLHTARRVTDVRSVTRRKSGNRSGNQELKEKEIRTHGNCAAKKRKEVRASLYAATNNMKSNISKFVRTDVG